MTSPPSTCCSGALVRYLLREVQRFPDVGAGAEFHASGDAGVRVIRHLTWVALQMENCHPCYGPNPVGVTRFVGHARELATQTRSETACVDIPFVIKMISLEPRRRSQHKSPLHVLGPSILDSISNTAQRGNPARLIHDSGIETVHRS